MRPLAPSPLPASGSIKKPSATSDPQTTSEPQLVFISYSSKDRPRVETIVAGLRARGLRVFWDQDVSPGASWLAHIEKALGEARCVAVIWTSASVATPNPYVHDEAARARSQGKLLQVRLDDVCVPLGFGEQQYIDLRGWDGDPADPAFETLAKAVAEILDRTLPPPPRRRRHWRRAAAMGGAALSALAAVAADAGGIQRPLCLGLPLRAPCAAVGWGRLAGPAEAAAWKEALQDHRCEALRAYLRTWPDGEHADAARDALTRPSTAGPGDRVDHEDQLLPVAVSAAFPLPSREEAREEAQDRLFEAAVAACRRLEQSGYYVWGVHLAPGSESYPCTRLDAGWLCPGSGSATCRVQVLRAVERCE